jgi:glycosyltransferase involved in cell wall biosynthesis
VHVLMVNNIYPPIMAGGAELVVADLCEGFVSRGHQVTVISTCGPEMEPYPVEVRNGVTVIRFFPRNVYWNFARQREPGYRRVIWHLRDAWNRDAAHRLRTVLDNAAADIVHTHLLDGLSASVWHRARRAGIPVVHTAHDYHLLCPRAFLLDRQWQICRQPSTGCRLYRRWHLRTAELPDLFVSPSRFLLEQHRAAGFRPRREAVVRNGIPLPQSIARIRAARNSRRKKRFLLMCRLTVEKGVLIALQAASQLPAGVDFEFIVAGRGPLEPAVRAAAAADPRIRYAGYVSGEDKVSLLAGADVLLVPSLWYENAPLAVIEAAAYGLGVVASRIGGIPELVREGRTGLLFAPGDAAELAGVMGGLADGTITLPTLAQDSWDQAQHYTVARMVDDYAAQYDRLLADHARIAA